MKITRKDWVTKEDYYTDWYRCHDCGHLVAKYDSYCSNCGVKIEWDIEKETK